MSTNIPAVQNTAQLRDAEFVAITIVFTNGTTQTTRNLYFSTSYQTETIGGNTYSNLGALMGISAYQRDISASGYDTAIAITGLDPQYIYFIAGGPAAAPVPVPGQADIPAGYYPLIKGSTIQIRRGFYTNYTLTSTVLRYTGLITSYTISEEREGPLVDITDNYTISLQCSAIRRVLENRISGRKTNPTSWKYWYPTDTSMDRVPALETQNFDFGRPVTGGGSSSGGGTGGGSGTVDETQLP